MRRGEERVRASADIADGRRERRYRGGGEGGEGRKGKSVYRAHRDIATALAAPCSLHYRSRSTIWPTTDAAATYLPYPATLSLLPNILPPRAPLPLLPRALKNLDKDVADLITRRSRPRSRSHWKDTRPLRRPFPPRCALGIGNGYVFRRRRNKREIHRSFTARGCGKSYRFSSPGSRNFFFFFSRPFFSQNA